MLPLTLREVQDGDLPLFFAQQQAKVAYQVAAFLPRDPADAAAFAVHWQKLHTTRPSRLRTIAGTGQVTGYVARGNKGATLANNFLSWRTTFFTRGNRREHREPDHPARWT